MSTTGRPILAGLAAIALMALPGCVAWEVRDEVHSANQRIDEVDGMLLGMNENLDKTNERIVRTQELLEGMHASIRQTNALLADVHATIQQTNTQLADVQGSLKRTDDHLVVVTGELTQTNPFLSTANSGLDRLRVLDDLQVSLNKTNTALLPLQKAMASLGGTMSFLGLGSDETPPESPEPPQAAAPTAAAPSPAGESPGAQPSAQETDVHAADARSTARLLGTWILVHPAPSPTTGASGTQSTAVFVLLSTGAYLEGDNGKVRASGKWTRSGSSLTLTPDTKSAPTTFEIIGISARSLTVRSGDAFRVYARP